MSNTLWDEIETMLAFRRIRKRDARVNTFGNLKNDTFDFEQIESYFRNKDNSSAFQVLSDKTCNDLDFQELFMFVDRTGSRVGQQYLYNRLRTIPSNNDDTSRDEVLIGMLASNSKLCTATQKLLSNLNKMEAYFIASLFQEEHQQPPRWYFIVRLLSLASLLSAVGMFFYTQLFFIFLGLSFLNLVIHYWNKRNINQYLGSIPQLLRLNRIARELYKNDAFKTINPNLPESLDVIDKIRNRMMFFQLEAKIQGEAQAIVWSLLELFKIMFLLEPLLLFSVMNRLNTKRKEIEVAFKFVGHIDSLVSIASLREGLDCYCIPTISKSPKSIVAEEMFHPLIPDCVTNSIQVDGKSILLTGSNMSGKTSFIRTVGINVITGLTLNTCFAKQLTMPRIRISSAIRISDDLMNDRSYYFEEVLTIKEMIDLSESGKPNLFLLDEIFKGTNTVERISAGKAVLSHLIKSNNIVFVSTHDIELADLLDSEYELHHFSEIVDHKTVDFDYKLKDGRLKNRNAIKILQINSYPENLIREAIEISQELDKKRLTQVG